MVRCALFTSATLAALSAALPLIGGFPAQAADPGSNGPYVRAFGGYSLLEQPSIQGDNITNGSTGNGTGRGSLSTSGGFWGGAAGGYHWGVFRLEGMGSYESHSLGAFDSPQFSYVDTGGRRHTDLNAHPSLSGDLRIFTGFLNAVLDVKFGSAFEPFIGGGVGFAHVTMSDVTGSSNGNAFKLTDSSDTVLAFQALAGFAYRFTPTFAAELGYRFVTLNDPSFKDNLGGSFDLGIEGHQAWLGLRVDF